MSAEGDRRLALAVLRRLASPVVASAPSPFGPGRAAEFAGAPPTAFELLRAAHALVRLAQDGRVWPPAGEPAVPAEGEDGSNRDVRCSRGPCASDEATSQRACEAPHHAHPKVADCLSLVRAWYTRDDLRLAHAAKHVQLSACYLERLLKKHTGAGFAQHLTLVRLARAEAMLAGRRHSVKEIAAAVGFTSSSTFDRAFRRIYGVTPTAWQLHHADQDPEPWPPVLSRRGLE